MFLCLNCVPPCLKCFLWSSSSWMPDILRRRPRSAPIPGTGTNIFFFLLCVCCVFVSLCKGVVVFLVIITGLVSYKGDVSGTGSAAIPTDGECSKEPLRVMNVVSVMEAGALVHVHVHSSKVYCGSTRTGPRALHQLVRSKNSNTRCFVVFSLFSLRPGSNVELYRCRT